MARFLSRQWRIDFLSRQLDRNAKHMAGVVMSDVESGRVMIEIKDRRDGAPYGRLIYSAAEARAFAAGVISCADVAEVAGIAKDIRDVRQSMS